MSYNEFKSSISLPTSLSSLAAALAEWLPLVAPTIKFNCDAALPQNSTSGGLVVSRLPDGTEGIKACGIDKLIQIAASQLSDQLPESREAARGLLLELHTVYEKFIISTPTAESEHSEMGSWEHFCQSKLSPLIAQAVLRITNIAREGLVLGS